MFTKSIAELAKYLASKQISSVELTKLFLKRIKSSSLNAFISTTEAIALQQAKAADEIIAHGNKNILTGIPMAFKDIFCTASVKTSCGSKMLDNFYAPYESTATLKLQDAGVIMLGKTNMDEFAMGSSTESSFYGPTLNPWNLTKIPGGSSGGSAAAVAAGLSTAAIGSDTGGSIRQPASMCGITGLKPTYGTVSRYGMIAYASSLDQGGPMTKTAEDAAIVLNAMAGFDAKDSTSSQQQLPDFTAKLDNDLTGLKIGIAQEFFTADLNSEIQHNITDALQQYQKLGATLVDISLPNAKSAIPAYYVIASAECSSNLSRYDGIRFGFRAENPKNLEDLYQTSRAIGFGDEVKRRIMTGTYVLSAGFYDAYYLQAQKLRRLIANDFHQALAKVDVIMGPVTPDITPDIGSFVDSVSMYLSDIYTLAVNLSGLPAMSIPIGLASKMPVGLQLIGKPFADDDLLNYAHKFQQNTYYHLQTPPVFNQ